MVDSPRWAKDRSVKNHSHDKLNLSQPMVPSRENAKTPVQPALAADEIESLLKMARENARVAEHHNEDLGPGDVQYLRGSSQPMLPLTTDSELAARLFGDMTPPDQVIDQVKRDLTSLTEFASPLPVRESERSEAPQQPAAVSSDGLTIEDLGDVDLNVSIELGRTEILIEEILKLREGSVVALDKLAGDPVDIVANGRLVARGELLVVDGKFGVRLSEVL